MECHASLGSCLWYIGAKVRLGVSHSIWYDVFTVFTVHVFSVQSFLVLTCWNLIEFRRAATLQSKASMRKLHVSCPRVLLSICGSSLPQRPVTEWPVLTTSAYWGCCFGAFRPWKIWWGQWGSSNNGKGTSSTCIHLQMNFMLGNFVPISLGEVWSVSPSGSTTTESWPFFLATNPWWPLFHRFPKMSIDGSGSEPHLHVCQRSASAGAFSAAARRPRCSRWWASQGSWLHWSHCKLALHVGCCGHIFSCIWGCQHRWLAQWSCHDDAAESFSPRHCNGWRRDVCSKENPGIKEYFECFNATHGV